MVNFKTETVTLGHKNIISKLEEKNDEYFGITTVGSLQWHYHLCIWPNTLVLSCSH